MRNRKGSGLLLLCIMIMLLWAGNTQAMYQTSHQTTDQGNTPKSFKTSTQPNTSPNSTGSIPSSTSTKKERQAIVLFIEGLSFRDLQQLSTYPHVDKWLARGVYAAMSIRPPGPRTAANGYLLMGAGRQAVYQSHSGTAYQLHEEVEPGITAQDQIVQLNGNLKFKQIDKGIIFPGVYKLQKNNQEKPYGAHIGLLGSLVKSSGKNISLYGNGDQGAGNPQRQAALFAMDDEGYIPTGEISNRANTQAATYPFGLRTNYAEIHRQLENQQRAGMLVVQLSDLQRLYQMRLNMNPDYFQRSYVRILRDLDKAIGRVLEHRTSNQMVMLLSPAVNDIAKSNQSLLTPVVVWKENSSTGYLQSATTRQPGIVSALDVAPTILSWLSIPAPKELLGHVMEKVIPQKNTEGYPLAAPGSRETTINSEATVTTEPSVSPAISAQMSFPSFISNINRIENIYANRPAVMYSYVVIRVIVLVAALILWIWKKRASESFSQHARKTTRIALLSLLFFPFVFLLEPLLAWQAPAYIVLGSAIIIAASFACIMEGWRLPKLLFAIAAFSVIPILVDGFTGAMAMKRSYMGYDPVVGARFYGLGNEYEGVLIGSCILLIASVYEWWNEKNEESHKLLFLASTAIFSIVLYYMAAPALGTNAGGFLAGTIGFGIALLRLQRGRLGKKGLLIIGLGASLSIVVLIAGNLISTQPLTHVGRVAQDIVTGNWTEVTNIIQRKVELNLKLIRVSSWSKVLLVSLLVVSFLSVRPTRYLYDLSRRYPFLAKGFGGIVAGSLAGLILNDSGVVSAATSIVFFVVSALYIALQDQSVS